MDHGSNPYVLLLPTRLQKAVVSPRETPDTPNDSWSTVAYKNFALLYLKSPMHKQCFTAKDKVVVKKKCLEWKLEESSEEDPNRMSGLPLTLCLSFKKVFCRY